MIIGYVRVSKDDQNEDLQMDAMRRERCERIYVEKVSGVSEKRPEFEKMREALRSGDVLVIWDIDRLGRGSRELIEMGEWLNKQGILFKSIQQPLMDTTTDHGELIYQLFAVLAQHERKRLIRRTRAGLDAARARGRKGGRRKGLSTKYQEIAPMVADAHRQGRTFREIMKAFKIGSPSTVYSILNAFENAKLTSKS